MIERGNYDPNVATLIEDPASLVPEEVRGLVSNLSLENPVANLGEDYLMFHNSILFSPAAELFRKNKKAGNPCYTTALPGTTQFKKFWIQEKHRCLNGYTVGGVYIPGEYYFYLNYCLIEKKVVKEDGRETKELDFPDFVSMDYYWFLELEKAENPIKFGGTSYDKRGLILAKARRKGFSYKNAAGALWIYTFFKKSRVVIASELDDKAKNTFNMVKQMSNFLNEYTEFRHPRLRDTQDNMKSGWIEKINGQDIEKGYLSEIRTLTLKDNPDKSAGLSSTRFIFEEAGLINLLKKAYRFAEPTWRDGEIFIGIPIVFGTGGDMEGSTRDFADMFEDPDSYGLKSYHNIYEETDMTSNCGLFVDEMWFRPGASYVTENGELHLSVDDNGNAFRWVAELALNEERAKAAKGSKQDYDVAITQKCKTPTEAFLKPQGNVFPIAQLNEVRQRLRMNQRYKGIGVSGDLVRTVDAARPVKFVPNPKNEPIYSYPFKRDWDVQGSVVIYQSPPETEFPSDMYKIGYDPVKFDIVDGKTVVKSLASLLVYKGYNKFDHGYDEIVAEYTGRFEDTDKINEIAMLLSMYYGNAKIMHENEIGKDVISYFKRKGKIHLLEVQPNSAMGRAIKNSKVSRVYGAPMNDKMKAACEKWALNWLWTERGKNEDGELIYNMDLIPSLGLIEELIAYNREGNFDRVMAFFQLMLVIEEYKEEEYKPEKRSTIAEQLLNRLTYGK